MDNITKILILFLGIMVVIFTVTTIPKPIKIKAEKKPIVLPINQVIQIT